jgi:hypothetical protein
MSRVVQASSATMAILCPTNILKKLDFQTFGLQIMVTLANI